MTIIPDNMTPTTLRSDKDTEHNIYFQQGLYSKPLSAQKKQLLCLNAQLAELALLMFHQYAATALCMPCREASLNDHPQPLHTTHHKNTCQVGWIIAEEFKEKLLQAYTETFQHPAARI